jgi:hypothetical protein
LPRITQEELAVLAVGHIDYFALASTAVRAGAAARELQTLECLPPIGGCAELQAARRFLVRHFIRTVECSTIHIQSGSMKGTDWPPLGGSPLICMEVPFHLCTRARPSQNEKPQALLWNVAG